MQKVCLKAAMHLPSSRETSLEWTSHDALCGKEKQERHRFQERDRGANILPVETASEMWGRLGVPSSGRVSMAGGGHRAGPPGDAQAQPPGQGAVWHSTPLTGGGQGEPLKGSGGSQKTNKQAVPVFRVSSPPRVLPDPIPARALGTRPCTPARPPGVAQPSRWKGRDK